MDTGPVYNAYRRMNVWPGPGFYQPGIRPPRLHGDTTLKRANIRTAVKLFIGLFSFFIGSGKKRLIFVFIRYGPVPNRPAKRAAWPQ